MALSDHLPGAGLLGGVAGVAGDVLLNSGELILSLVGFLVTSPDVWLTIVMPARRLASMVPWLPKEPLEALVLVGLVLTIIFGVFRFIDTVREKV